MGESDSVNKEIYNLFLQNNLILTVNSVDSLSSIEKNKYSELIEFLKEKGKVFVDDNDLGDFKNCNKEKESPLLEEKENLEVDSEDTESDIKRSINARRIPAKEHEAEIKFTKNIKSENVSPGSIEDFVRLFNDRYAKMKKMFRERPSTRDFMTVSEALRSKKGDQVSVVGMITEKNESKKGNLILTVEDDTARIKVFFSGSKELDEQVKFIMLDEIIWIKGSLGDGIIFGKEFEFPDLPISREVHRSEVDLCSVHISDIHVGSNAFLEKSFLKFIKWLNVRMGSPAQRELASRVKYLVIAGDLVDGVGTYPNQEKDLKILDVYDQYDRLYELLSMVPDWIRIIMSPGNHDATRNGEPQLPVEKQYAEKLYELPNVDMVPNPSFFEMNGVGTVIYHGTSIYDFVEGIPGIGHDKPVPAMKEMLRKRHLAPVYGGKTPISPEDKDYLLIDSYPEIFHTGHIHVNGYGNYRGTSMINSGGWQAQTDYQKMRNIMPTPGRVPIFDLKTHKISIMGFCNENGGY
ncbi:MAG TPA: DNA-directed DNA polymerase II small subunit [Methanofastidiosum sp.]|nr:DNA-directed DNA polymerase II small subunit [Methanofastidiosum sp.]HPA48783.1 DNA-directed DNA polymerase II small subunit [Methanofastidiosum sp.]HQK61957.1 DNA-directed DNA polymerase II small subunit [Methanofastidiosum sp.]HQM94066.1 DNA-directed DNA polymerase II small subunit [Methanofastidiosum sp.]HQQ48128.1 DNA-directed DNA polymerase II small subunit [Methanofastidiosum sp.]